MSELTSAAVAQRLRAELGEELALTAGRDEYRRLPAGFWSVHPRPLGGRVAHLVTLSWGLPPAAELDGLAWGLDTVERWAAGATPRWVGRTDFRGQCWVHGLPPGEYRLCYVARPTAIRHLAILEALGDAAAVAAVEEAASSADGVLREAAVTTADRLRPVSLSEPVPGVTLRDGWLRVERFSPAAPDPPLLRVALCDEEGEAFDSGFVGFARVRREEKPAELVWAAETALRGLFPAIEGAAGTFLLRLRAQPAESLGPDSHDSLAVSLAAASPRCRSALAAALGRVRHTFCARLPAAAFGLPLGDPGAVAAVLPGDEEGLRELARRAISRVYDRRLGNKDMIAMAGEWTFGQGVLDPFDRLRWLDAATHALGEQMRRSISEAETVVAVDPAIDIPTTAETVITHPAVIRLRLQMLDTLAQADADSELSTRVYRLLEFADEPFEQVSPVLGLSVKEAKKRRRFAKRFLAGEFTLADLGSRAGAGEREETSDETP